LRISWSHLPQELTYWGSASRRSGRLLNLFTPHSTAAAYKITRCMSGSLNVVAIYLDPMNGGGINASADRLVVVGGTLIVAGAARSALTVTSDRRPGGDRFLTKAWEASGPHHGASCAATMTAYHATAVFVHAAHLDRVAKSKPDGSPAAGERRRGCGASYL
jgi:hypothetical protein